MNISIPTTCDYIWKISAERAKKSLSANIIVYFKDCSLAGVLIQSSGGNQQTPTTFIRDQSNELNQLINLRE